MGKMSNAKSSRRRRVNFNVRQLEVMETVFTQTQYPDVVVIERLANGLDLPLEKILTWFQNRRSKFRRGSKSGHINWMRQQLFTEDPQPTTANSPGSAPTTPSTDASIAATCHVLTKTPSPKGPDAGKRKSKTKRPLPANIENCFSQSQGYNQQPQATPVPQSYTPASATATTTAAAAAQHSRIASMPHGSLPTPYVQQGTAPQCQPISNLGSAHLTMPANQRPAAQPINVQYSSPAHHMTHPCMYSPMGYGGYGYQPFVMDQSSVGSAPVQLPSGSQPITSPVVGSQPINAYVTQAASLPSQSRTPAYQGTALPMSPSDRNKRSPCQYQNGQPQPISSQNTSTPAEYQPITSQPSPVTTVTNMQQPIREPDALEELLGFSLNETLPQLTGLEELDLPDDFLSSLVSDPTPLDNHSAPIDFPGYHGSITFGYPTSSYASQAYMMGGVLWQPAVQPAPHSLPTHHQA